jgi:serine/threonine protein kinase
MQQTKFTGTPYYMAPEIHRGEQYDWAVDVYAYGVLVYATIVGKEPYEGSTFPTATSLAIKVIGGLRPVIPDDVAAKWQTLMRQCWDNDPTHRPNFEEICRLLSSSDFVGDLNEGEASRFSDYCERVSPPGLLAAN